MKPITVSVTLRRPIQEVYDHLAVLGNHEPFTDHFLADWQLSGPAAGVGAAATMRAKAPGPAQRIDMQVVEAEAPRRLVEEAVSAKGRRRTRGTYTFEPTADGGTLVRFELRYLAAPAPERVLAPLIRPWLVRVNEKAMRRLGEQQSAVRVPSA